MTIPTATDKVILIDFTLPETNVFVLTEYETNQQFSTLDVGSAFIGFKAPTETGLDGMTAKISLVNLDDDSFVNHTETIVTATNHVALDNVYYYQVRRAELERQGKWIGRVLFVDNNGKTWGTRKFTFLIDGDILNVKRTKLHAIDSVEDFMEDMSALMLDFNGFITRIKTNETTRGTTFTTTMTNFTDLFNQAQQLRTDAFNQAQSGRTGDFNASELSRTQTFDASEASRTSTFNASEASRGNTFTQNENTRQAEFDLGESTRNDGFDADHLRAGNDHTQAVTDSTRAGTDHSTAVNDHSTAQSDHTIALVDHTIVGGYNERLATVDVRTEFDAKNLVVNADFANGTTGWTGGGGTYTASNGVVTLTVVVVTQGEFFQNFTVVNGRKYYARMELLGTALEVLSLSGTSINAYKRCTGSGSYEKLSVVATANGNGFTSFRISSDRSGDISANPISMRYPMFIDLTATFGAGKEPTLAEFERLLARYPNSWFDGTKPIQTIETLYQEKANKVQEAWITPTLLNGWIDFDTLSILRYFKDNFGVVRLKGIVKSGTINTNILTLPVEYRPKGNCYFPIVSNGILGVVIIGTDGSVKCSMGTNAYVSLDGISFVAEQ